jgi:SAM-dependent methyltransferase
MKNSRIKARARKHLGGTRAWRAANVALYYCRSNRLVQDLRSFAPWWVYRKLQSDSFYDGYYFDAPKDPQQESGYGDAYGDLQDFTEVAGLAREIFRATRVLDAGCAKGFQVRALRQAGVEAWGFDLSAYAVAAAPQDTRPWLKVGNCLSMDFDDCGFDLLLVMETLEHIPPGGLDATLDEINRVCSRWVLATIPSDGLSHFGPEHAGSGGKPPPAFFDPIVDFRPFRSLEKDRYGFPLHGHISIASQDRWTELFSHHGFARRGEPERRVAAGVDSVRRGIWIPYVFEKAAGAESRTYVELRDADWRECGGIWAGRTLDLPAGHHVLRLGLRLESRPPRAAGAQRSLHVRALSADGDTLHGTRLFDRHALRAASLRGEFTLSLPVACPQAAEVAVQLQGEPALRFTPSPGILVRLHA